MPLQSTKTPGLFTFGAGVIVGLGAALAVRTTMPKATEMIGLIMQKLGFELGDILLALWDPEAQLPELPALETLPATKKKKLKTTPRKGKSTVLSVTPRIPVRIIGKTSKLAPPRRVNRSSVAVRLN